jgi:phasin family protein
MAVKKFSELAAVPVQAAADATEAGANVAVDTAAAVAQTIEQVETVEQVVPATSLVSVPAAQSEYVQTEVKVTMERAMKTAEDFVSFGQGNIEAFVKAGQIWAAGVQDMGKQFAATAQAQMDHTVATMKALAGVKSLKEAMELQSSLARASMEKAVAETGKLTDASLKLTEQAIAPITARVTLAMEKFGAIEKFGRTA